MSLYPPFYKHTNSGTVVDTRTQICVASVYEKERIGQKRDWNYLRGSESLWEPCENPNPNQWTDAFGITHDKKHLTA